LIVYLTRPKPGASRRAGDALEDELSDLRHVVRMQEEKINELNAQVKELTDKLQSRGSTDITT
jgi:hypothetical protein